MSYLYENIDDLFCNKCNRNINKYTEMLNIESQMYCIYCDNWITPFYDAFGIKELEEE